MSELPRGWGETTLGTVANVASGIGFPNEYQGNPSGDLPFCKVADVSAAVLNNNGLLARANHYVSLDVAEALRGRPLRAGSTAFAKIGEAIRLNRRAYVVTPCLIDNNVMAVTAADKGSDRYIHYFLRTVRFDDVLRATTVPSLRKGDVEELAIPLAPLPEQKRIADKLDTVLARVDACRDRLDRISSLLKRFRQSILAAATFGRLTEDRRVPRGSRVDISQLLDDRLRAANKESERKALAVFLEDFPPTQGLQFDLPPTWISTHIGSCGVVSNGSTPSRAEPEYWNGSISWVSSGEVRNNEIHSTREQITDSGFRGSSVRLLPPGTVLIAMIGEGKTRGQSALLNIPACINQNVAGVVPLSNYLSSRYLWYWFQGQYEQTRTQGSGTGPQALNCQRVRELHLNLPPLDEQNEIVRRVEILFAFADRLEARLATARKQVGQLTPALLAKAFRGELVPQDPNDEPAAELLKRLASERETAPKAKRGRRAKVA